MSVTVSTGSAVDLTQTIENGMTFYVGDAVPRISKYKTLAKDGVNLSVMRLGSHTGTHVDAPAHFVKGGKALDELSVESFVGEAEVVDVSDLPPGSAIAGSDLQRHASSARAGDVVLIYTGFSRRWRDPKARRRYTYLGGDAADWLVKKGVKAVGIDYLSVEGFGAPRPVAHLTLLSHGIPIIESLAEGLAGLVGRRVFFVCLPIKIGGCDGAPARAMAYPL
ncbi:MAG: cyclase family protein [Nitrososphaerota archaeon]|nr:cyclase family protein [Nitrososphaerota archaeon]MDG6975807.1 cyclase family protein [Nitrososphaerota archaeon]MDG6980613.1 cyclase family protein [Nitrososphaerota archaeon]MDG7009879.1 cyclase family protein [Nitrososphaerota archaeon]MDG7027619.1 cyclase family protein [Nitrososphaerota archaeon]